MATATSNLYLVDPITGFSGEYRENEGKVRLLAPEGLKGQYLPVDIFISRNSNVQVLECDPAEFEQQAARLADKAVALDFFLILFDAEVRDSTKCMAAIELEKLFADEEVRDHVLDIVYAAPLPPSASYEFVAGANDSLACVMDAQQFLISQDRIRNLYAVWAGLKDKSFFANGDHERLTGLLISASFFRNVVTQVERVADTVPIQKELSVRLNAVCDPQILLDVMLQHVQTLPVDSDMIGKFNYSRSISRALRPLNRASASYSGPPRVFISYSNDSPQHLARVVHLSETLRSYGIDCVSERDAPVASSENESSWSLQQIENATFVICVLSPHYERQLRRAKNWPEVQGDASEDLQILSQIWWVGKGRKCLSVVLDEEDNFTVPLKFRGSDVYNLNPLHPINPHFDTLVSLLTNWHNSYNSSSVHKG